MAIIFPKNLDEYNPTDSERDVYLALKSQLPDWMTVFYSVSWTTEKNGHLVKSEADFIVAAPEYGYLCLEVKGGNNIWIDEEGWHLEDKNHGERVLARSPYDQAEASMYYLREAFGRKYHTQYHGIYASGVVLPYFKVNEEFKIDNRHRRLTIDMLEMNSLSEKIKDIFKAWGGSRINDLHYTKPEHQMFLSTIKEKVALSAAAGALVKYKERQLSVINRVQDNYITFLTNIKQFYIRGGAGTGKTWIALKMARKEAEKGNHTLYVCASKSLAAWVKSIIKASVDVYDLSSLFERCYLNYKSINPCYLTEEMISPSFQKYDAIFVDEGQDLSFDSARLIKLLLVDSQESRLGVFYDEVQVLKSESFGNGFGISSLPFLLNENIRNTASIYSWTAAKTNLGKDVIVNPVEGPEPETQEIREKWLLVVSIESLLKKLIVDECLSNKAVVILVDNVDRFFAYYPNGIAQWQFSQGIPVVDNQIRVSSVVDFKGLESDVVIYVHGRNTSQNENYIAYTRAKYYLKEFIEDY